MPRKIMLAALAAGLLALNAPAAVATTHVPDPACGITALRQKDATGQNYEGAVWGYIEHPGTVSIRCYVTVNGSEVATTPTVSGNRAAVTHGPVSYAATPYDDVKVCSEFAWDDTSEDGDGRQCRSATHRQACAGLDARCPELTYCIGVANLCRL